MAEKCVFNPDSDCIGSAKIAELRKEIDEIKTHNAESHKEFYTRLSVLESQNQVQDVQYANILEKLANVTSQLSNISNRLAAIELKPAKRWDGVVEKVLFTIVGAVIMYFLSKAGM